MAEARRYSTSVHASHRILGSVLRKSLDWSWKSACRNNLLARFDILSYVVAVTNEIFGASRKITDARYILLSVRDERAVNRQTKTYVPFSNKIVLHGQYQDSISDSKPRRYMRCVTIFMFKMTMDRYRLCLATCRYQDASLKIRGVFETIRGTLGTASNVRITDELESI